MFLSVFECTFKCAFKYLLILDSLIIPPTKATRVHTQAQLCLSFSTSPRPRLRKENHLWFGIARGFELIILTGNFLQELLLYLLYFGLSLVPGQPSSWFLQVITHPSLIPVSKEESLFLLKAICNLKSYPDSPTSSRALLIKLFPLSYLQKVRPPSLPTNI